MLEFLNLHGGLWCENCDAATGVCHACSRKPVGIATASLYAAAAEKSAAAQRADEVRKKLTDRASKITCDFKRTSPTGQETEADSSEEQARERRPALKKKCSGGEERPDEAISTWA